MVVVDFTRIAKPGRRLRPNPRRPSSPLPFVPERLPLGTFTQGRPLRRAIAELAATVAVLVSVTAGLVLLQPYLVGG